MTDILAAVRKKYPAYADVPDDKLALAIGTKYSQYLDASPEFAQQFQAATAQQAFAKGQIQPDPYAQAQANGTPDPYANTSDFLGAVAANPSGFLKSLPADAQTVVEQVAAGAGNLPARLYRKIAGTPQVAVIGPDANGNETLTQQDKPLPFQPGQPVVNFQHTVLNPEGNAAQNFVEGFLTPGNIALFPFAAAKPVQAYFLAQTAPGAIDAAEKLVAPGTPPEERRNAATDFVINALMSHGLAKGIAHQPGEGTPVPTTPESVQAQADAALDPNNPRAAVLQVPGEVPPTAPGLVPVPTEQGTAHVNPDKVNPAEAQAAFNQPNGGGNLLGMASNARPEEPTAVVTTRDAQGTPVTDEAVTPATQPAAVAAAQAAKPEGGSVEVRTPAAAIDERRQESPQPAAQTQTPTENVPAEPPPPTAPPGQSAATSEPPRFSAQRAGGKNIGKWVINYVGHFPNKAEASDFAERLNKSGLTEKEIYTARQAGGLPAVEKLLQSQKSSPEIWHGFERPKDWSDERWTIFKKQRQYAEDKARQNEPPNQWGVPESQWQEMAKYNDYQQMERWGTTRAKIMEQVITARHQAAQNQPVAKHPYKVGDKVLYQGKEQTVTRAVPGANFIGVGKRAVHFKDVKPAPEKVKPLTQEWNALRQQLDEQGLQNALLAVRLGDFYEFFHRDAKTAATALNLALSERNQVPMAGIPAHAAEKYFAQLTQAGHKVAVVNAAEPATPGAPTKRTVTAIYPLPGQPRAEAPAQAGAKAAAFVKRVAKGNERAHPDKGLDATQGTRAAGEIKAELLQRIQQALAKARSEKDPKWTARRAGTITIEVPGDGKFTIVNSKEALTTALGKVKALDTKASSNARPHIAVNTHPPSMTRVQKDAVAIYGGARRAIAALRRQLADKGLEISDQQRVRLEDAADNLEANLPENQARKTLEAVRNAEQDAAEILDNLKRRLAPLEETAARINQELKTRLAENKPTRAIAARASSAERARDARRRDVEQQTLTLQLRHQATIEQQARYDEAVAQAGQEGVPGIGSLREEGPQAQGDLPAQAAEAVSAGRQQPAGQAAEAATPLLRALLEDLSAAEQQAQKAERNPHLLQPLKPTRQNLDAKAVAAYADQYEATIRNAIEALRSADPQGELNRLVEAAKLEREMYHREHPTLTPMQTLQPSHLFWRSRLDGISDALDQVKARLDENRQGTPGQSQSAGREGAPLTATGGELGEMPKALGGGEPPPADDNSFSAFNAAPMEMPEAVRVVRLLTGVYPKVREALANYAGVFIHSDGPSGKGRIEILASQFQLLSPEEKLALRRDAQEYARTNAEPGDDVKNLAEERYQYLLEKATEEAKTRNPVAAMKTMWHEIGHLVDWLPDKLIRGRGNIFGRIASIKQYFQHVLPFDPTKPAGAKITEADKARLRKEAEQALRDEMGPILETIRKIIVEEPEWAITGITPEDIKNILRESAGKETPELTRWFSEQSSKVKADILRKAMKGIVDERLAALGKKVQTGTRRTERTVREKVGREPTPAEIKQRFAEMLAAEIKARNLADLATVKGELGGLIAWWRGTATIPDYFKSSSEMYADAFSVWANNPAAALKRAPTYSELMWNYLDRKPEVKALYDEIQRQIKSGQLMGKRVNDLQAMWEQDDERNLEMARTRYKKSWRDVYDNVAYHFDRRFGPIYRAAKGYRRYGAVKEAVGTFLYRATEHERFLGALNRTVGKMLVDAGLDWTHDFGEYLYHKRVIEERYNLANPLGFTPKNSLERLAEMEQQHGPQQWRALEQAALEFRRLYEEHIVQPLVASNMFTPELNDVLLNRTHYATFAAVRNVADTGIERILDTKLSNSITPHIYRQIGNLGEIKNPATATVLKGLSLISAAYRNTMKREVVRMLQEQDPDNIMAARTRWNGKFNEPKIVEDREIGTVIYMQGGKPQAYYVRRVVADGVNGAMPRENAIMSAMTKVNGWMKSGFTQVNYAFWPVNFVRDTAGFQFQMPGYPLKSYVKNLPKAIAAARQSVLHSKPNVYADEALRRKMVISRGDPRGVWAAADNEFELKVASFGMEPAQWSKQADKVHRLVRAWNWYRELGETVERINKISGMLYLDEKFPDMPEWQKREIIRERSGSPNFLERGASNPAIDMLFLFYNPWKESVRSVAKAARDNPFSFAAKTTVAVMFPTVLQSAAVNGWLGPNRKKEYASIPDYDLTNYLCVPLGWADEKQGKITYLRLPLWEPARIAHGSLFQVLTGRGRGIINNAGGQLPGLNPILATGLQWSEYLMGENPVDLSRATNIMPDTTFQAGGLPALEAVAQNTWNNIGGSILYRFQNLNLESPPQTLGEKFLRLPIINNALGRWIKVSDRGLADTDREATAEIEQHRAQLRLAVRPIADKILTHQALTPAERMVLREPYAINYLHVVLPEMAKTRASLQYRRLHSVPSLESRAAVAKEMKK